MSAPLPMRGFSLLELMIVVSITAILASVAIPGFRNFVLNSQRASAVNDLMASLQLARSETTKLGRAVVVCPANAAGTACTGSTTWSGGWLVFANLDNATESPPVVDSNERVLQLTGAVSSSIAVTASNSSYIFRPFGSSNSNGNIKFCDSRGASHAKTIIISPSGRARLSDVDSSGNALTCS